MLRAFCDLVSNWLMYADSASDPVLEPEHRGFRPDCVLDRKVLGGVQSKPVKHNSVYSSNQDDYRHNTRFAFTTTEDHYARVVQVEERMNGNSAPEVIVQVEKHGQTIPVLLPENFLIAPQKGDHWLLSAGGVLREDNVLVPKSVQYARTKNDAILRIIGDHLTLSKQSFILFEQSVCMAAEAIPDGFSKHPGVMYKIDAVESRQPRGCSWRAWRIEMVTPEERAALRDMLVDEEIDFGEIAFGTSVTKTVTISNKDGAAHRLTKIALYGCHICRVHPISISEPYFSVGAPHFLYDAIHFHPFRKFDFLLPVNATAHVNVKMAGTEPGQWKFALKFFFEDRKMRSCLFSANVLQSDGSVVDQVRADPEWRLSQDRIRRQVAKEAAIRVREADYEKPKKKYNCKQKRDGGAVHDFRNHYDIPCELMDSLSALPEVDALQEQFPVLKEPLNYDNYADKLHLLLHLEEFAEELGVHERFDKVSDELEQVDGTIFKLGLLDLSEGRPSLMSGDHVFAKTIDKMKQLAHSADVLKRCNWTQF
ncbi:uncharacterized protein LOC129581394 isoform X2 [Paramacrobiotus metropolitanus]|uniref:uncharacterized protein LOC129581394 isoform X2 n=1 Tax=Paramacrobiotus metropolitanus TaxID=2943436 RepID=UPI0024465CE8|nr:uncharacterized protein LOC129581394 isoform X2 [Paramacrobiotus metropolitanus]